MPTRRQPQGTRPIIYPKSPNFRDQRETARLNDMHSANRLPEHPELTIGPGGEGYDEVVEQILKYSAVTADDAAIWLQRMVFDPGSADPEVQIQKATVLGVKVRWVKW